MSIATISLVLATACGSPSAAAGSTGGTGGEAVAVQDGSVQRVTIKVGNAMQFTPFRVTVSAGVPVELVLQNDGVIPHDFVLTEGVSEPVKIDAPGGRAERGTFTLAKPGTYTFICSVAGHAQAGMRGTIVVQ